MNSIKKILVLFLAVLVSGCAATRPQIKAISKAHEVVIAEGMAPILGTDIAGAKETALSEAMKNALGLVVGVYVSQEALVSKAVLIEDNIISQTEGYIERYDVISEGREGEFYRTKIKALVRKEDLAEKIKKLELEPKKLGNPVVSVILREYFDSKLSDTHFVENIIKESFLENGYIVSDSSGSADIYVLGKADSYFNTDQGLGGLISYRGTVSVRVAKSGSQDLLLTRQKTAGGVDSSREAAAKESVVNAAKTIAKDLPSEVTNYLKKGSVVNLSVSNIESINQLNDLVNSLRALIEVRDCWVRSFSENKAVMDLDLKRGTAANVSKRLEQLQSFKVRVTRQGAYSIEAELIK